jgi:hypothetical protein
LNIQVVKDIIEKQTQFQDKDLVPSTSHDELRELYNLSLKNVIELNNEITLLKRKIMNKYENKYLCEKENIKLEIKETEYIEDKTSENENSENETSENETSENETSENETSDDEIIPTTNGIVKWIRESESCIITITDDELEEEQQEKTVIIKKEKVETESKLFIQNESHEDEDLQEEDVEVQTEEEKEEEQKAEEDEQEEEEEEEEKIEEDQEKEEQDEEEEKIVEDKEEEDEVQTEEEEDEVQTEEEDEVQTEEEEEVQTEEEEEEEAEKVIPSLDGGANPPPLNLQNMLIPQANYNVNHNNVVHDKENVKVEEDVKVEKEEEEEELFEIEIDEITYCTSDEENGIIYEIDKEGDVGKKVGYLKDGEPFFYE